MKILIWCSEVSVGGGRLLANLVAAMAELEEVQAIHLVIHSMSMIKEKIPVARQAKIQIFYVDNQALFPLRYIARDFDVVYCFWPHTLQYEAAGKPMVCTFHDTTLFDYTPPFLTGRTLQYVWRQSKAWLENCDAVAVPSNHVKVRLQALFGESCAAAAVIPYTLSPAALFDEAAFSPAISDKIPAEYIVYPANTCPHKNHYNLLSAYARIGWRKECPLVLCGENTGNLASEPPDWPEEPPLPALTSLISRLGLKPFADYIPLGYVGDNDVNVLIKNAKALIMPSLSEAGGGLPVEEALSMGTPVLCSDIPVMREHLSARSATVAWFDPESPAAIAAALEDLRQNYDTYKKSAADGRKDIRKSWRDIAGEYINVFAAAIAAGRLN